MTYHRRVGDAAQNLGLIAWPSPRDLVTQGISNGMEFHGLTLKEACRCVVVEAKEIGDPDLIEAALAALTDALS